MFSFQIVTLQKSNETAIYKEFQRTYFKFKCPLVINSIETELITAGSEILEMHKEYLDIHIPLDTSEIIGWKQTDKCKEINTDYNAENDYMLYNDKPTCYLTIELGEFFIVYPEDAHAPLIGKGNIRKLIAKVKI